jgi:hypothetical protein
MLSKKRRYYDMHGVQCKNGDVLSKNGVACRAKQLATQFKKKSIIGRHWSTIGIRCIQTMCYAGLWKYITFKA